MDSFYNIDSSIVSIKNAIKQFSNIDSLFEVKDYLNWHAKLLAEPDYKDFLFGNNVNLNFLNLSAMVAYDLENTHPNHTSSFIQIYSNLNRWLGLFPQLMSDDSFKIKLKNLSAYSFSATLSELSISAVFKSLGYSIKFETAFKQLVTNNNRDVDVSIFDNDGNVLHIEVYMPNDERSLEGFIDINEGNADFKFKVERKLEKKFGIEGISGLNGVVLLAINIAHFDLMFIKSALPFFSNNDLFLDMKVKLPKGIDGMLFFSDGFTNSIPFHFEQLVLKDNLTSI